MPDWFIWLSTGLLVLLVFCIYSLSSQVERCFRLAVDIITRNQRAILERLDAVERLVSAPGSDAARERRSVERRRRYEAVLPELERRRLAGRRRADSTPAMRLQ